MRTILAINTAVVCLGLAFAPATYAQNRPVLLQDSFPIGEDGGLLCRVQDRSVSNPARESAFDRRWAVVCRDSALPVATIYAFENASSDLNGKIAPWRRESVDCTHARSDSLPSGIRREICAVDETDLEWSVLQTQNGSLNFIAEGFLAYEQATVLALRSVVENEIQPGTIDVATTMASDPFAFARVQAQTLEPEQALAEGYRRNLGGDYAEAAAYFEALQTRLEADPNNQINLAEFDVNRALQMSNLGEFGSAERLFRLSEPRTAGEPVPERLQRNFEAIHLLNMGAQEAAIERLDRPLSAGAMDFTAEASRLEISMPLSERLNGSGDGLFGFVDDLRLTTRERAAILDAQALQLRGVALRLEGRPAEARGALLESYARAIAVRDGRVTSITRLRAQTLAELAIIAEAQGDAAAAEGYLRNAVLLLEQRYPQRQVGSAMRAKLASFLLRQNRREEAFAAYREVIDEAIARNNAATGFANQLSPYLKALAGDVENDPQAADNFFAAMQVLVRPGVAETQAILARELSAGDSEAARLFRQSTDLARDIERTRFYLRAMAADDAGSGSMRQAELQQELERLEQAQLRTQAQLSEYPQYRVVRQDALALSEFKANLNAGESFARLALVGSDLFMFWTDEMGSKAWRLDMSEAELDTAVDTIRETISVEQGGVVFTDPFDLATARSLYQELFAPVTDRLAATQHLIFEPDAAMLRLPLDVLVADDASVAAYQRNVDNGGDTFDFTGVKWLARDTRVSTAVSARSFVEARQAPRSTAAREYIGFGENAEPDAARAALISGSDQCGWSIDAWQRPIDATELRTAQQMIGTGQSEVVTEGAFTDDALMARDDLNQFRVLHFATHGLVTPPNPSCPARPALLTSFGGADSDGLLSFEEIFDLNIDADVVILSACDTAGGASIQATREAGVGSGGGTALDGLVRSFIGAGGRAVLASHWPLPDDYDATERLVSEMFRLGQVQDIGSSLRGSQRVLMDDPGTSHPFYWAGLAVIGDAARPLLSNEGLADATVAEAAGEAANDL